VGSIPIARSINPPTPLASQPSIIFFTTQISPPESVDNEFRRVIPNPTVPLQSSLALTIASEYSLQSKRLLLNLRLSFHR
jgi:hypothetical protein